MQKTISNKFNWKSLHVNALIAHNPIICGFHIQDTAHTHTQSNAKQPRAHTYALVTHKRTYVRPDCKWPRVCVSKCLFLCLCFKHCIISLFIQAFCLFYVFFSQFLNNINRTCKRTPTIVKTAKPHWIPSF